MGLLTLPLRLPFLPIAGLMRLAEVIQEEADREWHDPAAVRRALDAIEQARLAGEISPEEAAQAEQDATARLVPAVPPAAEPEAGADQDAG